MPIYEYKRPDGTTFELQQSFSEEALSHDPETGVKVQRVLHAPAVHFKGKGFYNTDYGTRNRQRENAASAEGSESASSKDAKEGGASKESKDSGSSKPAESTTSSSSSEKKENTSGSKNDKQGAAKKPKSLQGS